MLQMGLCHPASATIHFLPVLTMMPVLATLGLPDSVYCCYSHAHVTMHSSLTDLKGRLSLLLFPYSMMLLKLQGNPSHLLLTFLSKKVFHQRDGDVVDQQGPEYS